jgi:glycosyltransferase involved in cell wall biosynthesis
VKTIGYVLKRYPRLSETFILQEILGLERLGLQLYIFAIMDPHEEIVHADVQRVRAPVHYLRTSPLADAVHMLWSHARLFFRAPRGYLSAFKHVLDTRQPNWNGLYLALRHFMEAGYLVELVRRYRIDHLHAHFANNPTSLARFAQLLIGVPFSFTAHAKDIYTVDPCRLADKIQYGDFTVTCTAYNRQYLNSLIERWQPAAAASKVHLIYHGIDIARFRSRRLASPTTNAPQILSIGRLVTKKGHSDLIQACKLLKQKGYRFNCDIYGAGPLQSELEDIIRQLDVGDRVSLQGARPQEELIAIYQSADVFVLAPFIMEDGDRDGLPNVLLEAMACGLPVIASNISGIPELITNGETGLLVEPRDVRELASALGRLLADSSLRARLAAAGQRRVEQHFAAESNFRALAALFEFKPVDLPVLSPSFPSHTGALLNCSQNAEVRR